MFTGPIISKSGRCFKWVVFLTLWGLSFAALLILCRNKGFDTIYNESARYETELKVRKNQTGRLNWMLRGPENDGRAVYFFYCRNFLVGNSRLGIFKTALHKAVKIWDLRLRYYQYTTNKIKPVAQSISSKPSDRARAGSGALNRDSISVVPGDAGTSVQLLTEVFDKLAKQQNGWRIGIDLSNVSEVLVDDFSYQVFRDNALFLSVQSKKAIASYRHCWLVLCGHVTIKTAKGNTLESNRVRWDVVNKRFTADGIYVLNCNGVKTVGRKVSVDVLLNPVGTKQAKSTGKERGKCLAKLSY